jgi:hypothetical protein
MTIVVGVIMIIALALAANFYYTAVVLRPTQEYHIRQVRKGQWDALAFGSAYCRFGIDFSESSMNGYNLGFGSQFLYYTQIMLHQNARFAKRGGHIFIICADLCFAEVGKGLYNAERYLQFVDKEHLGDEYSLWRYFKEVLFPLLFHPKRIKALIKHILGIMSLDNYELTINPHNKEQVEQDAKKRCSDWCSQFGLKDTQSDEITETLAVKFQQTQKILIEMIEYCLDNDLHPIIVCTPVSRQMNDRLSDRFLDKVLYENIRQANKANVPFLDYTRDPRFQDARYYTNADFMNAEGRKKFTKILVEDAMKV